MLLSSVTPHTTATKTLSVNHPAVVGTVHQPTPAGFTLAARNSDCVEGGSAFFWLALSGAGRGVSTGLVVDSGATAPPKSFAPDCVGGDWQSWTIAFSAPFGSPPVVLVTGNNAGVEAQRIGVVGTARDVTETGFTLKARNSDCASGQAGFVWVAIGGAVLEPTAMPMGQCIT